MFCDIGMIKAHAYAAFQHSDEDHSPRNYFDHFRDIFAALSSSTCGNLCEMDEAVESCRRKLRQRYTRMIKENTKKLRKPSQQLTARVLDNGPVKLGSQSAAGCDNDTSINTTFECALSSPNRNDSIMIDCWYNISQCTHTGVALLGTAHCSHGLSLGITEHDLQFVQHDCTN